MKNPIRLPLLRRCRIRCCWAAVAAMLTVAGASARAAEGVTPEDLWSLAPVRRPELPPVERVAWPAGAIDRFILAELEAREMEPAPDVPREKLVRRVCFDLLGLPPSPEEVRAFMADDSPAAYEHLVDRLLASPHYGERWARYWLDLARFAETNGYERDALKENAWKYRDWVIRALNDDLPYDRFVLEQLAGDELPDATEQTLAATGFLRVGTFDDEPNDPLSYKYEQLDDLVHSTSTAFLAITLKCARCHDHKFDPILQTDYYATLNFFIAGRPAEGPVLGYTDQGSEAPAVKLLKGGDSRHEGDAIAPAFLSMIPGLARSVEPPAADAKTTMRRTQLARWITDRNNPLTARVMVNRLWQHHFGEGLVRTPDNFGMLSAAPTHPKLLDWLAVELTEGGWRLKRLHKLILLSRAYRMDSVHPREAEYAERDFSNDRWWRASRRRLEAEALRDAMLAVSGQLNVKAGGPSFYPPASAEALEGLSRKGAAWGQSPPGEQRRRSIYMMTKRSLLLPLMTTFDFPDTTLPCSQRDISTVAPQALALLNNEFVHEQSDRFAARIVQEAGSDPLAQLERAWWLALGRAPAESEREAALAHLRVQQARFAAAQEPPAAPDDAAAESPLPVTDGLVLQLDADRGVTLDDAGRVANWHDQSGQEHHALQDGPESRPLAIGRPLGNRDAPGERSAIHFDGAGRFLHLAGQVLSSQRFSIVAVASDQGGQGQHREIFSNWNGAAGNSVTSVFLGATGTSTVRFSDDFGSAGQLTDARQPLILTAVSGVGDALVYQGRELLASKGSPLAARVLGTPYVVGQQGNIGGEFWHGDIAALLVYDRELNDQERKQVWGYLESRYGLAKPPPSPAHLALASLCHVLLNTNEFIYID